MYAIIRTGGKQAKVKEGDLLDVERLTAEGEVTFTPLLIVAEDGTVVSDRDELSKASVVAEVMGTSMGPKVDIFKYRAKTGYRRRQGHRQKYTQIRVTKIELPGKKKAAKKASAEAPAKKAPKKAADEAPEEAAATAAAETAAPEAEAAQED